RARAARPAGLRPPDPGRLRDEIARLGELRPARETFPAREGGRGSPRAPLRRRGGDRRRARRWRSQADAPGAPDSADAPRAADRSAGVGNAEAGAGGRGGRAGMGDARASLSRIHVPLGGTMDGRRFVRAGVGGALALAAARLWAAPAAGATKFLV